MICFCLVYLDEVLQKVGHKYCVYILVDAI